MVQLTASPPAETGAVAHVTFRVRCETLGHGEQVYLAQEKDSKQQMLIPLYTTAAAYPWYHTVQPLTVSLHESPEDSASEGGRIFRYRYLVHRGGTFHRFERASDCPSDGDDEPAMAIDKEEREPQSSNEEESVGFHKLPLRLLVNRESYVVNDVLGAPKNHPDIDHAHMEHAKPETLGRERNTASVDSLHSRSASGGRAAFAAISNNSNSSGGGSSSNSVGSNSSRKKTVGFAPAPPPYHAKVKSPLAAQTISLSSTDGLVVVSAFLPVVLHRSDEGQWTADWDYEVLLSMQTHLRVTRVGVVKWRGWHGNTGLKGSPEAGVPVRERHLVEECLRPFNCVPVWIDTTLFGEMYNGFCKGVLWPVMHHVTSVYSAATETASSSGQSTPRNMDEDRQQFSECTMDDVEQGPIHGGRGREKELWSAYNTVNRKFAEVVVQCFNEGDLVWIHGFHLLILPSYLTRRIPMAKIGIFLHTPFPSSEIFRSLWCREDLLRGMLNADQVGFHLYEYARHFLTCCRRLLGLNYGMIPDAFGGHTLAIDTNGRHVSVTSIHAGIEPPVLNQIINHDSTEAEVASIRSRFEGKHIFFAIDRLESLKGIPLKLLALEHYLRRYPHMAGKVVLIQIGISAFERGEDYYRTRNEVTEMVNRINEIWPGSVQFQECSETSMKLQQRLALMRASDVALVTPIRDGLNLLPLEYTIAHDDALRNRGEPDGRKRGLCILSEFASCTRVMRGALHVNPWKISEISDAIHQALTMSDDERMRRISTACEFVKGVTTQRWAVAVLLDLKGVSKSNSPVQYSGAGLGLGYRLLGMDAGFAPLDFKNVVKSFKNSRSRLILVDYGGTIASNDNVDNLTRFQMVKERKTHSLPSPEMLNTLKELCSDKKNSVFVVSGKERHSLTSVFGTIPNLGLAAEHGMYISWPTSKTEHKRHWETLVPITDRTWRTLTMNIMQVYASRTHGSYIEETEMKVLWQYRDADLEFGYLQARELEDHLSNCLHGFPVDILHGGMAEGGYVEVRPKGVNKGVLAMRVIRNFPAFAQADKIEFALTLGDDHCDEPMLSVMRQIGSRVENGRRVRKGLSPLRDLPTTMTLVDVSGCDDFLASNLEVYTSTVGMKPSAAENYLHEVSQVQELLDALVKISTRDQKYYSQVDLRSYAQERASAMGPRVESATMSTGFGIPKSWSLNQLQKPMDDGIPSGSEKMSTSLGEYLGAIDDEEEEDGNIFF
eukprot:Nitzschia sp. Nitz4//scaffold110_size71422//26492//30639//NITZ4_005869-RA/size71422-snap-gene-0.35-mRNA-1//-1//CDS//3329533074//7//frame0